MHYPASSSCQTAFSESCNTYTTTSKVQYRVDGETNEYLQMYFFLLYKFPQFYQVNECRQV